MSYNGFTWLHIKKSAGSSIRRYLQPHYLIVDKLNKPKCFIQADKDEYNDILNNYRVVLGEYQFKRALFASKYLYPNTWLQQFSFAFSRNPTERCISMFHYLCYKQGTLLPVFSSKQTLTSEKETAYAFDKFLKFIERSRNSESIYKPINNHFTTHTNSMWNDITDKNGNIILTKIYKLENLTKGINEAFEACNITTRLESSELKINQRSSVIQKYKPTNSQYNKIECLFNEDFEIYECAN